MNNFKIKSEVVFKVRVDFKEYLKELDVRELRNYLVRFDSKLKNEIRTFFSKLPSYKGSVVMKVEGFDGKTKTKIFRCLNLKRELFEEKVMWRDSDESNAAEDFIPLGYFIKTKLQDGKVRKITLLVCDEMYN